MTQNINNKTPFFEMTDSPDNIAVIFGFVSFINDVPVVDIKANELNDLRVSFLEKLRECLAIIEYKNLQIPKIVEWAYIRNDKFIIERILQQLPCLGIDNAVSQFLEDLRNQKIVKVKDKNILKQLVEGKDAGALLEEYDRKTFSKIYKWIGLEKDFDKKISTIIEGKIYCSMPTKVNDLLDCQIAIADCDWAEFLSKLTTDSKDIEFNMNRVKLILKTLPRLVQFYSCSKQSYENIASTSMWGQYADHGNGICLEYDIDLLLINHMRTDKHSFTSQKIIQVLLSENRIGNSNRYNMQGNNVNYKQAKKILEALYPLQDKRAKYFCANAIEYLDSSGFVQKRSELVFKYFKQILNWEPQNEYQQLLSLLENYFRYKTLNWRHEEEVRFSMFPYYTDTLLPRLGEIDRTLITNRDLDQAEIEGDSIFANYECNNDNKCHDFIKPSAIVFGYNVTQDKIKEVQNKINDPQIRYLKITGAIMTNEAKLEVHPLNQL